MGLALDSDSPCIGKHQAADRVFLCIRNLPPCIDQHWLMTLAIMQPYWICLAASHHSVQLLSMPRFVMGPSSHDPHALQNSIVAKHCFAKTSGMPNLVLRVLVTTSCPCPRPYQLADWTGMRNNACWWVHKGASHKPQKHLMYSVIVCSTQTGKIACKEELTNNVWTPCTTLW